MYIHYLFYRIKIIPNFRFAYQLTFYVAILTYTGRREKSQSQKPLDKIQDECFLESNNIKTTTTVTTQHQQDDDEYVMHKFFRKHWSGFLMQRWSRIVITVAMLVYLLVSLVNTAKIQVNIQPLKILPDNSRMVNVFR